MKRAGSNFCISETIKWEDLGGGISRQILGWDNQIMMVKIRFEKGATGSPHQHFHAQTTYCVTGEFEFTIGNEKQIIKAGDGVYIPPNMLHGAVCLKEGNLIDVFSPVREDFLGGSQVSYPGGKK